ncbi:metastasis-suppressor KiSS-1 [Channa argus]|uniref:metastasis-suppressor KiSS-1 n=1 Tax=Channa argus TaxID=215402 RepID=UPI003521A6EF
MMPQLILAMMIAALSTEVCTISILKSTYYHQDQAIFKALRDLSQTSIPASAKTSGNLFANRIHSTNGTFLRRRWWIIPQSVIKRQDMSTYNLNSFGLRYGK